ncbi:MAG: sulfatase [Bacteroidetes bacterium]|nr:sulfatase [Bacteroidota bacterium]MBT4399854.1 sulfatase [Bacteroidota bacterium]MBT4410764.1 sulfatase [Bacteroidota bacterium]MBT5427609.1 sulfatase [Bacteroidota bacterium]MBT7465986.1 sulfatase [Bacteroidota bacterium]
MSTIKTLPLILSALFLQFCSSEPQQPNVLFIAVDDLRPELACYGADYIHSPNMDKLADQGFLFTNHYVSVPTCGASRFSLLTGNYPVSTVQVGNEAIHKDISGKPETEIPESFVHHLRRNGYYTVGIGKVSHYVDGLLYGYTDSIGSEYEMPHSWDEMLFDNGKWGTGWNAFFGYADGSNRQSMKRQVKPYEGADVGDNGYPDGLSTQLAIKKLRELVANDGSPDADQENQAQVKKPFFLAVGYFKPHLPFNSPKKYWDLYDESEIPLSPFPELPENVHKASLHGSGEFNGYQLGDEKASLNAPVSDEYARKLRHAYAACVSYIDAQIGILMNELEELNLDDNTHVIIWGDHGWHLGDQMVWGKHTIFDYATRSTLIIRPRTKDQRPKTNDQSISYVVGTVDLYPTIMELCGIEMPYAGDGESMMPLMNNPEMDTWKNATFSYFRKGISLRTERYRLTKYFRNQEPVIELYDHNNDPYESKNIAQDNPEITDSLMRIWEKGNTGLYSSK